MNRVVKYLSVLFLILFGGLTVFLTSSVLFDLFGIREKEGNYVEFIVWINLISGLLFLWSAYSFWREKKETTALLLGNLALLIVGMIGLYCHIKSGGLYKMETVKGMLFRIVATTILALVSYFLVKRKPKV